MNFKKVKRLLDYVSRRGGRPFFDPIEAPDWAVKSSASYEFNRLLRPEDQKYCRRQGARVKKGWVGFRERH